MELDLSSISAIIDEIERLENVKRKTNSLKSYEVYEGALKKYVLDHIKKMYPKSWELYTIADYSLEKKIVDKKAKSYKEAVARKLSTPEQSSIYQEMAKRFCLNESMKKLDQLYNQHKYALVGCMMDLDDSGQPMFNFMPLAPHEFDVIKNDKGDAEVVVLSYPTRSMMYLQDSDGMDSLIAGVKTDEGAEVKVYAFWTATNFYIVEQTRVNQENKGPPTIRPIPSNPFNINPWGVLPFVYVPINDGANYPIQSPLTDQTIELNALLSVYLTSGNMQVGQLVLKYPEEQKIQQTTTGMMTVLKLPQKNDADSSPSTAEYISPSPNMEGHRTSIMTFADLILDQQGIRSATGVGASSAEKFSSGLDRAISEADVQDIIEDNQQMFSRVEEKLYRIVKAQLESINNRSLTDETIQVIYRKPKILVTDTEILNNLKLMEELGLVEPWEKFIVIDPNMTEDEAKQKLARIEASKEVVNADNTGSGDEGNRPSTTGQSSEVIN
jgi:hypothetical protein